MTSVEVIGDVKDATCLTGFPNSERLQLFDVVACSNSEERGDMALGLVVLRAWKMQPTGMELQMQIRVFDGTPQDRLKIMREDGYLG